MKLRLVIEDTNQEWVWDDEIEVSALTMALNLVPKLEVAIDRARMADADLEVRVCRR